MSQCQHCQSPVSPSAVSCPQCGHPIAGSVANRSVGLGLGLGIFLVPLIFVWFLFRKGHSTLARILGFGWAALALLFTIAAMSAGSAETANGGGADNAPSQAAPSAEVVELPRYEASELATAYDENTVSANARFKGKRFIVSGTVVEIATDFMDRPYVTLAGGLNEFMEPQFSMKRGHEGYAGSLRKGDSVVLECTGAGDIAKIPMNRDCVPVN